MGFLHGEGPEHRHDAGERLAQGGLQLLAAPHQIRVQPDARGVEHDELHLFRIVRESAFNSDGAHVRQRRLAAFRCGYRLHQGGRADVPGEVVQGSAGQHQQRKIMLDGGRGGSAHSSVPAPHPERADARNGGCLRHPLRQHRPQAP